MRRDYQHLETKVIHAGEPHPRMNGAVTMPIFQTAMFETPAEAERATTTSATSASTTRRITWRSAGRSPRSRTRRRRSSRRAGWRRSRPRCSPVLKRRSHAVQDCTYGGTYSFVTNDFARSGTHLRPHRRHRRRDRGKESFGRIRTAVYVEAMTNPRHQVADLAAVVSFARAHGLVTLIDSTFASPVNFRPHRMGFDLSCTAAPST